MGCLQELGSTTHSKPLVLLLLLAWTGSSRRTYQRTGICH